MPADGLQHSRINTERLHGRAPAVMNRRVEHNGRIGAGVEPGVFFQFIFQLGDFRIRALVAQDRLRERADRQWLDRRNQSQAD